MTMELISRFREGFEANRQAVYTFSHYYLGDGADAEDVTQEVFIKYWQQLADSAMDNDRAWLLRVTRNACIDQIRRRNTYHAKLGQKQAAENASPPLDETPARTLEQRELMNDIRNAIFELDDPYRSVLVFREIQELAYTEIAEALEMPLNRVKVYLHRGRKKLREILKERMAHENGHV